MNTLSRFVRRHKIAVLVLLIIFLLIVYAFVSYYLDLSVNYNTVKDADTLNIYKDGALIKSVSLPADMEYGTGMNSPSLLGLSRLGMRELYVLAYVKEGKTVSTVKILTPRSEKTVKRLTEGDPDAMNAWNTLKGEYVILYKNFRYFSYGQAYFDRLAEWLK